jgi:tRNA-dihydrouridine synthase B
MYKGEVDLNIFEKCINISQHKVVYKEEIDSFDEFKLLSEMFGKSDRGLLANHFIAQEIKFAVKKSYNEKIKIIRAGHDWLFAEYSNILSGSSHIANKMKKIWTYLGCYFENGAKR